MSPKYGDEDYDIYNQYHDHRGNPKIRPWHTFGHPLNPETINLIQWGKINDDEKCEAFFKLQKMIPVSKVREDEI